ncbi:MAG: DUF6596 domain-containing protein [Pseudonocardia sp.]
MCGKAEPGCLGRALDLATMLRRLLPEPPEVTGLVALILLTDARRDARSRDGRLVLLADQDRRRGSAGVPGGAAAHRERA